MTTFTPARAAEPDAPSVQQTPRGEDVATPEDQLRKQEADRAFEAGVQWFLAVSRAA